MENIIKTLKLSEAVLKGVANFPELDTTQKHLIGHTLKMLNDSLEELSNSHKHSVVRPASALSDGGELLQGEGMAKAGRSSAALPLTDAAMNSGRSSTN